MDENIIAHPIPWGIGFIIVGVLLLWFTITHPVKGQDINLAQLKGYLGSIGFILMGILIIIRSL